MNMNDLIVRKRDGGQLSGEEIRWFVKGYTEGDIPDYQAAALLMAVYFNSLDREETFALTEAMRFSGDTADLSAIEGIKVDKHSTGGVGDKTTLIAGPLAAACGVPVAKMSGRGLGFTGGTIDKIESVPGLRTVLSRDELLRQVRETGIAVISQSARIAPADKKIYALRDVTGTVDEISLIASSVMSKKLASGCDAIVLDVKCGDGAFMRDLEDAEKLGRLMGEIGSAAGKRTAVVITDMNQPLGYAVGNSLEVIEAIEVLKGRGPYDITELSIRLAGMMVFLGEKAENPEIGCIKVREALKSGAGLEKLRAMILRQGGEPAVIDDYSLFPKAALREEIYAWESGYVSSVSARCIGASSQRLGAGRAVKEDSVDPAAGILLRVRTGSEVRKGSVLAVLYGNDSVKMAAAKKEAEEAFAFASEKPELPPFIWRIL